MSLVYFIFGLCIGSFINMAAYRYEYQISFWKKSRSFCDFCKQKLSWQDNLPVISWIILGGKSRCCHKKLPLLYPITELLMGVLFYLNFYFSLPFINLVIFSLLILAARIDLKLMILPDGINYGLIVISLVLLFLKIDYQNYLLAGIGSFLFFLILNRIRIRGSEAMGMGDVKYALFMGLYLGYPKIMVAIYIAFVVGAVVSLGLIAVKKIKKENPIPFGPFLILGTIIALFLKMDINMLSLFR